MNKLESIMPGRGDRAVFVGQTGCGKTTLAREFLKSRRYVVVLDAKGMIKWPGYQICTSFRSLTTAKAERLIYRPDPLMSANDDELEAFFSWVYLRRFCTLYVDELFLPPAIVGDTFPPHFGANFTRGRELKIEVWTASQRPKRIPQVALSESEHAYIFHLKMPQDRDRVQEFTGIDAERIQQLPKHDFFYSRQDAGVQGPLRLDLK
jgi:hypothetical protein